MKWLGFFIAVKGMKEIAKGLKTETNRNGFTVAYLHYSADPDKPPEWAEQMKKGYLIDIWNQEMELDFTKATGRRVYPEFTRAVHVKELTPIPYETVWRGWDFGYHHPACLVKGSKVLLNNLTWVPVENLNIGDKIISCEEFPKKTGPGESRTINTGEIISITRVKKPCLEIGFNDNSFIVCSKDHRILGLERDRDYNRSWKSKWRLATSLNEGDEIPKFFKPWEFKDTSSTGWVSGFFDGEGCISTGPNNSITLSLAQVPNGLMVKLRDILEKDNFGSCLSTYDSEKPNHSVVERININGGWKEMMRFLGMYRPTRLLTKFNKLIECHNWHLKKDVMLNIEYITDVGEQEVYVLETTTHTYFADGFAHHNCVWFQIDSEDNILILHELLGNEIVINRFAQDVIGLSKKLYPGFNFKDAGDPAVRAKSDKSERTSADILRSYDIRIQSKNMLVRDGINMIRNLLLLRPDGKSRLKIDNSCQLLISGFMGEYLRNEDTDEPIKDGYMEHIFDALRYGVTICYNPRTYERIRPSHMWVRKRPTSSVYTGY